MSNARIPDLILEKYGASHPEKLLEVQNKIGEEMKVTEALTALSDASKTVDASGQRGLRQGSRTVATPDWQSEPPININKVISVASIPLEEFERPHRPISINNLRCSFGGGRLPPLSVASQSLNWP